MRRVILTVGPQGAGKSTYCKKVYQAHPHIVWISRDVILTRLFGTVWLNHYTGGHYIGEQVMWKLVARRLKSDNLTLILDHWNDCPDDRRRITAILRHLGADRVEAWRFTTPLDTAYEWFYTKNPRDYGKLLPDHADRMVRWDYEDYTSAYHAFNAEPVDEDQGFDEIRTINPLEILEPCL